MKNLKSYTLQIKKGAEMNAKFANEKQEMDVGIKKFHCRP